MCASAFVLMAAGGVVGNVTGLKETTASLLTLLGIFCGVTFAFDLNENKERLLEDARHRAALSRGLFVLVQQRNVINQIAKIIRSFDEDFNLAFDFISLSPAKYADLSQRFDDLEFILDKVELDPNFLMRLTVEQSRFEQAIEILRSRDQYHFSQVQPAIERAKKKIFTQNETSEILGDRIFQTAMGNANKLRQHVAELEDSLVSMHNELRNVARKLFPSHKFISYDFVPQSTPP